MKKYSDKFINQNNKLGKTKIGFEFEFYLSELSYYKTLEILNQELKPVKVWGFRQYHSSFVTDDKNFKIEPDLSGGSNMVELVTGPLSYYDAKYYLVKILKFINTYGYTNDKCSIHFNISIDDDEKDLNDLNVLKLILNVDEDEIYSTYPSRKNNIYAKSVKTIIPFKEYDFFNISIDVIKNNMRIPNSKYYGVNFTNILKNKDQQRVEFRYLGGKDYEKNIGQIIYFMDKFALNVYNSTDVGFTRSDINLLQKYLEDNITKYKNLSEYNNFITEFPSVILQVNQNSQYEVVSAYYNSMYSKLYTLIDNIKELSDCIINFVTETKKIEIVDADIKVYKIIEDYEFINCIVEGMFENCCFVGTDVKNSQLQKCKLQNSDAENTKLINCNVERSTLIESFFVGGYLNGDMKGGVFRSGKIGPYATLDLNVKIVKNNNNFFNTRKVDVDDLKQKGYKSFGKNK
jgi:hypothetical protein